MKKIMIGMTIVAASLVIIASGCKKNDEPSATQKLEQQSNESQVQFGRAISQVSVTPTDQEMKSVVAAWLNLLRVANNIIIDPQSKMISNKNDAKEFDEKFKNCISKLEECFKDKNFEKEFVSFSKNAYDLNKNKKLNNKEKLNEIFVLLESLMAKIRSTTASSTTASTNLDNLELAIKEFANLKNTITIH